MELRNASSPDLVGRKRMRYACHGDKILTSSSSASAMVSVRARGLVLEVKWAVGLPKGNWVKAWVKIDLVGTPLASA